MPEDHERLSEGILPEWMEKDSDIKKIKIEVKKQREWSQPAKSDRRRETREAERDRYLG